MNRFELIRISLLFFGFYFILNTASSQSWIASPQVITGERGQETVSGFVFHDSNKNGMMDINEMGVAGVLVSNGLEWVRTDEKGYYEIKVRKDMTLTIVQPSGWRVPTNERMVPQFFYVHKEGGTRYPMRFGGLPDTGHAPEQVNFPLSREGAAGQQFSCAILADPQTYNNQQLGWLRDDVLADIMAADYQPGDCMIQLGDMVGDDLGLLDRLLELAAATALPQ